MKLKIKLKFKNQEIIKILRYLLFGTSIIVFLIIVNFIKNNVYYPFTVDKHNLNIQIDYSAGRINKVELDKVKNGLTIKKEISINNTTMKNVFK